jgi:uncharacterized membrane protein
MRRFSFRPTFTMRGRANKGLRGWAGKPLHPPLTDVPVAAYVLAAGFDVASAVAGSDGSLGQELFDAASWVFLAGALVSVLTALTGWADWHGSSSPGTQARRTINAHAITMIASSVLVLVDLVVRYSAVSDGSATPGYLVALSLVTAIVVSVGASIGGTIVYDYGFNVETAGDSPVWHTNEADVLPGQK